MDDHSRQSTRAINHHNNYRKKNNPTDNCGESSRQIFIDRAPRNSVSDTSDITSSDSDATSDLEYDIDWKEDLTKAFEAIKTPGSFATWGALPKTPPTGLHVDGVGDIAMPLSEGQIRQLIAKAHQPPFDRRSET
ncbi:hypothetical protein MJO29_000839 [Puccinia striiformis f. sp. tritici]|nr:hypothetical protein MJO29_000839 [Puccinia striiformis f. sp. tritici]